MLTLMELNLFNRQDRDIIIQVYTHDFKTISLFAFNMLNDREEAIDITTDAFLKLCACKQVFKSEQKLKNYLYKIVRNDCLNRIKKMKVEGRYEEYIRKNETLNDGDGICACSEAEIIVEVGKALEQLDPREAEVIKHIFFGNKNHAEISQELNISLPTVTRDRKSALKKLRELLKSKLFFVAVLSLGVAQNVEGVSKKNNADYDIFS